MAHASSVTFAGHSTAILRLGSLTAVTDPNFSSWIWTLRRRGRPGIQPADLSDPGLILISHGHYDHLDMPSLRRLPRSAVVLVPPGLAHFPARAGFTDVRTLRWGDATAVAGARVTAVPAAHFPGRSPLTRGSLYQGYVVEGDRTVYFAGDTGLHPGMADIGRRFSVDLALLPIGAYQPWSRWGHHMTPEDAVEAFGRVRAKFLVPIHWGTFKLSFEPLGEPPRRLLAAAGRAGCADRVHILNPGQRLAF